MGGPRRRRPTGQVSPPEPQPAPLDFSEDLAGEVSDWSRAFGHLTVLGPEALDWLSVKPGGVYVDGTLGGGGHSRLILSALGPQGRLIALDQDPEPRLWAARGWGRDDSRLTIAAGNFGSLDLVLADLGLDKVDGIVLDLGLSSRQLLSPGRGFSWTAEEAPLDMRLNPEGDLTALEVVNRFPEKELADIIWRYGEERASRRIARAIVRARQRQSLKTTGELAAIVAASLWRPGPPPRIHPATRTFMALRIFINGELDALEDFLAKAPGLIKPGGRLVIISFHSLEDRLVKEAFRARDEKGESPWVIFHKKPITPGEDEEAKNPRSRSAKLRAAERA